MSEVFGVDVSEYQGVVDWHAVAQSGIAFGICKSTEGTHYAAPHYAANHRGIKAAKMIYGAYHFLTPGVDGAAQARHFLDVVGAMGPGSLPPVLDVEQFRGHDPHGMERTVRAWLETVEAAQGRKPMIYCSPGLWDGNVSGDFGAYPLWVAAYTSRPRPRLPHTGGWTDYVIHQYTDAAHVPGIAGRVDGDRFNGDLAGLKKLAGVKP